MTWFNLVHRFDPIGDELLFYSPTNVDVKDRWNLFGAHGSYWDSKVMYEEICQELGWLEAPVS